MALTIPAFCVTIWVGIGLGRARLSTLDLSPEAPEAVVGTVEPQMILPDRFFWAKLSEFTMRTMYLD